MKNRFYVFNTKQDLLGVLVIEAPLGSDQRPLEVLQLPVMVPLKYQVESEINPAVTSFWSIWLRRERFRVGESKNAVWCYVVDSEGESKLLDKTLYVSGFMAVNFNNEG